MEQATQELSIAFISQEEDLHTQDLQALLDVLDGIKQDVNLPADIRAKLPNITGSLVGIPPTSGTLTVIMDGGGLTCNDQAEFKCEMIYKFTGGSGFQIAAASNNFTFISAPNDIRITDALYEENGIQLTLTNNSVLYVGTRIMYRCTSNIGGDPNFAILWERSSLIGPSTEFMTYTPNVSNDIIQDPVKQTDCSYNLTSTMYYNLTSFDDDGITFRCKVLAHINSQWYESTSMHGRTFASWNPILIVSNKKETRLYFVSSSNSERTMTHW